MRKVRPNKGVTFSNLSTTATPTTNIAGGNVLRVKSNVPTQFGRSLNTKTSNNSGISSRLKPIRRR